MFSWHAVPFARILIPYIIGLFIGIYTQVNTHIFIGLLAIGLIVIFLRLIRIAFHGIIYETLIGVSVFVLFLSLGFLVTKFNMVQKQNTLTNWKNKWMLIEFDNTITEKKDFYRCYANLVHSDTNFKGKSIAKSKVLIYVKKSLNNIPKAGHQWLVVNKCSEISAPLNKGEFNYKQYLSYQGIYYQQFIDSTSFIKKVKERITLKSMAFELRNKIIIILSQFFDDGQEKEKGIAEAILIGYKDNLDAKVIDSFSHTGTLHVLAVSGLHAGIIFLILGFLTKPLLRFKNGWWIQVLLILLFLWIYAFVTGLSTSVVRATVMFSIMSFAKLFKTKTNIFNTIYSSAFILLVLNPFIIVDVGFQLSYSAVLGIVYIQPKIKNWYLPRNKLSKYIWDILAVSLAAQIMTFPIGIYYFHQFPNYFFFSNLFIIPLTFVILFLLVVLLMIYWIPFISGLLGSGIYYIIKFTIYLVGLIEELPFSYISGLHITFLETILVYAIIFGLIKYFEKYKAHFLLIASLFFIIVLFSFTLRNYTNKKNSFLVINKIKHHDVFTAFNGKTAYIISDSAFINNKDKIRFHLEPYFWENGINNFIKVDFNQFYRDKFLVNTPKKGLKFKNISISINFLSEIPFDCHYLSDKKLIFRTKPDLLNKLMVLNTNNLGYNNKIDSLGKNNFIKLEHSLKINCHDFVIEK